LCSIEGLGERSTASSGNKDFKVRSACVNGLTLNGAHPIGERLPQFWGAICDGVSRFANAFGLLERCVARRTDMGDVIKCFDRHERTGFRGEQAHHLVAPLGN
jgi:hypothetical protein